MNVAINSRAKGCRGELEFAAVLKEAGFEARRGQQFSGGGDSPDVISNVPGVHWEVKRVESGNLYNWFHQARRDSLETGNIPVVAHRKNGKEWLAILNVEDLLELIKRATSEF